MEENSNLIYTVMNKKIVILKTRSKIAMIMNDACSHILLQLKIEGLIFQLIFY